MGKIKPLRPSERKLILIVFDLLLLNIAFLLAIALRKDFDLSIKLISQNPLWFILLSGIWLITGNIFDIYDLKISSQISTIIKALLITSVISATLFLFIPFITPPLPASRLLIALYFILLASLPLAWRLIYVKVFTQPEFSNRAVLLTDRHEDEELIKILANEGKAQITLLRRFMLNEESIKKEDNIDSSNCLSSLGKIDNFYDYIKDNNVSTIILDYQKSLNPITISQLTKCLEMGIEIIPLPYMLELLIERVMTKYVSESNWYFCMPLKNRQAGQIYSAVKRIIDILISFIGLMLLSIVFPFIAAAIFIDSPGPIIYSQERVGTRGKIFKLYKFRTMKNYAEKNGPVWARPGDRRVTRVGKFLRKTHIDELPQLINILKGDMSIVGPRAERPELVAELAKEIPFYNVRHSVRPGATGWALLKQGYADSKDSSQLKLEYDLFYIKNQSIWLDMIIIFKTVIEMLKFRGRA
ncbi:MAG: sugar transferase [Thermodesulfobacteriota bacterium]